MRMVKKITLETIAGQIEIVGKRLEKVEKKVDDGFFTLTEAVAELHGRTASLEDTQEEILEKLEPLSRALDKDSEVLINHGRRITRIEKHVGIGRA